MIWIIEVEWIHDEIPGDRQLVVTAHGGTAETLSRRLFFKGNAVLYALNWLGLVLGALFGVIALRYDFEGELTKMTVLILAGIFCAPILTAVSQHFISSKKSYKISEQLFRANSRIRHNDIHVEVNTELRHSPINIEPLVNNTTWTISLAILPPKYNGDDRLKISSRVDSVTEDIPPFVGRYGSNTRECNMSFREWSGDLGILNYSEAWNGSKIIIDLMTNLNSFYRLGPTVEASGEIRDFETIMGEAFVQEFAGGELTAEQIPYKVKTYPAKFNVKIYVENRLLGESIGYIYNLESDATAVSDLGIRSSFSDVRVAENIFDIFSGKRK